MANSKTDGSAPKFKSLRLNVSIREDIKGRIKATYLEKNKRPEVIEKPEGQINELIIQDYMAKNAELYAEYSASKFKDCFKTTNSIEYMNSNGSPVYIHSYCFKDPTGKFDSEGNPKLKPRYTFLNNMKSGYHIDLSNPDTKVPAAIKKALSAAKANDKKRREQLKVREAYDLELSNYMENIHQVLYAVNTTGQLIEVWPEVERFLPVAFATPSAINLPAINITSFNEKLG